MKTELTKTEKILTLMGLVSFLLLPISILYNIIMLLLVKDVSNTITIIEFSNLLFLLSLVIYDKFK